MQLIYICIVLCAVFLVSGQDEHDIKKRSFYLLFPRGGVLQVQTGVYEPNENGRHNCFFSTSFTYGLTVPFVLPRRSINISWCFQAQYNLPYNISNFYPSTISVRSNPLSFDLPRIKFYEYLAKLLDNFGLNGENCVLRSVCEIAELPMYEREDSVLEKIVQFLFTPSLELQLNETSRRVIDTEDTALTKKLLQAEDFGKAEGSCDETYSKCIISIVDLMTVLYVT